MIDEFETSETETITFVEDNETEQKSTKKLSMEERMEQNKKSVQDDIRDILIRKERIQKILRSDHAGPKLSGSVWPERNVFENTSEGRIYSMSDENLKTLIDFHSNPGDTILDPFAGYLNSGIEILKMQRNYVGYEILESYHEKLRKKIAQLKIGREAIGLEVPRYEIHNEDSTNLSYSHEVDMILTTIPDPIFPDSTHKTQEMIIEAYEKYLESITAPILKSYDRLRDNGFFLIHCKDSVKGFVYRPTFMDIGNILRAEMPLKYTLILSDFRSPSGTLGDNGEMFKLYSEQTFPYSHQYVFCFYKGEGRLR